MEEVTEKAASDVRQTEKNSARGRNNCNKAGWRITVGDENKWRDREREREN